MATTLDPASGLVYAIKRPVEARVYTVDLIKILPAGVTISAVDSISIAAAGNVEDTDTLTYAGTAILNTKVSMTLSAGSDGEDYEVTLTCMASNGDLVSDDVMIKVRKAGLK